MQARRCRLAPENTLKVATGSMAQEIRSEGINKKSDKDGAYPEGGEGFPRVKMAGY